MNYKKDLEKRLECLTELKRDALDTLGLLVKVSKDMKVIRNASDYHIEICKEFQFVYNAYHDEQMYERKQLVAQYRK